MDNSPDEVEPVKESSDGVDVYGILSEVRSSKYSVEDRLGVVMRWISGSNMKQISRDTGIPYMTIVEWKLHTDWWHDVVQECRRRKQEELDGTLTGLVHDIMGKIGERIREGDVKYDSKLGTTYNLPVPARELATVAGILFDKRAAMRGDPTTVTGKVSDEDQLKMLKEQFKDFSKQLQDAGHLAKPIDSSKGDD